MDLWIVQYDTSNELLCWYMLSEEGFQIDASNSVSHWLTRPIG